MQPKTVPEAVVDLPKIVPVSVSRSGRAHKFPRHFDDFLPSAATPPSLSHIPSVQTRASHPILDDPVVEPPIEPNGTSSEPIETEPNDAGLYRVYPTKPTSDPDDMLDLGAICDSPNLEDTRTVTNPNPLSSFGIPLLHPFRIPLHHP